MTLADMARYCDFFCIGGTKNGALFGEALVLVNPCLKPDFLYIVKQRGGLFAKGRLLGIQFAELFRDGLYYELARHANGEAMRIKAALTELGRLLGLQNPPDHIEAFDISNIGGQTIVGGMTVFRRGRPEKRLYKKFTTKDQAAPDDYAAMEQMLTRRLTHYREAAETGKKDGFEILPDLWLIDGGAGQVAVAKRVAEQIGLEIPVFGMVKDDRHRTRAIRAENEEIAIRASQSVFRLVTNIQDETHRYAISFSRKKHQKAGFASTLTAVPGIGEQRAAKLLKHFKSMAAIRTADVETLAKAPGFFISP